MKKDREFFNLCISGDRTIIELLKNDKEIKNIKDNKGNGIYAYLMAGNQSELLGELLKKKLINYSDFKRDFNLLISNIYTNDKYIKFFTLLNSKDKKSFIEKNINVIIEGNNTQTILLTENDNYISNVRFTSLTKCDEEMLDFLYEKMKNKEFSKEDIKEGFNFIKSNKVRTSVLMNLISWQITPELYEDLNKINNYCISFLDNKDLYQKLEKKLEERKKTNNIKI